jgi:hypothetical protein
MVRKLHDNWGMFQAHKTEVAHWPSDGVHAWSHPPGWMRGGNLQTIWSALFGQTTQVPLPPWNRERWATPDGDFIDVDHLVCQGVSEDAPRIVLFHGLEGSSSSHYARAFAATAVQRGWQMTVPHFRGCSGEINLAPRAYHSGDFEEIDWILRRLRKLHPKGPMLAVGVSLGGNALLRWAEESGDQAKEVVAAVAAVSAPVDLAQAGHAIDRGFNRHVYARMFLRTMVRKAQAKWQQYPGLFDLDAVKRARTLYEFDNLFTAPLHGFRGTEDYWRRAAAKPGLAQIKVPTLVLNALNDPFVPAASLPRREEVGRWVTLAQPRHGGHVGFPTAKRGGPWSVQVWGMPQGVAEWLLQASAR